MGSRKRAVGTRDRIMTYLETAGEIGDASGKASTVLAAAIGYPGSSVAFAQLLTGMERSGLIEREIRGKRTYRIGPARAARREDSPVSGRAVGTGRAALGAGPVTAGPVTAGSGAAGSGPAGAVAAIASRAGGHRPAADSGSGRDRSAVAEEAADLDYDELARRLLVQVVQRLAVSPAGPPPGTGDALEPAGSGPGDATLEKAVASLEQKLASATSRQRRLAAENAKLREQLRATEQNLAQAQERASAEGMAGRFDTAEVLLLERLLSPLRDKRDRREEAGAG